MMSELRNFESMDVAQAAGAFLEPTEDAGALYSGARGHNCDMQTLCELAQLASLELRKHDKGGLGGGGAVRKRSRKSVAKATAPAAFAEAVEAVEVAAGDEEHDGKGLSVEQIGRLYKELTGQTYCNRHFFKKVMSEQAAEFGVSVTSLRNIVSFKNRRGDACQFWNDELWALYNLSVRCETCRAELPAGSRVLCTHFGRGRPPVHKEHREVVAARFRKSSVKDSAGPDELARPRESNSGLKRAYLVQIRLCHVWACLGCPLSEDFLRSKQQSLMSPASP
jgi:hypothetical protein